MIFVQKKEEKKAFFDRFFLFQWCRIKYVLFSWIDHLVSITGLDQRRILTQIFFLVTHPPKKSVSLKKRKKGKKERIFIFHLFGKKNKKKIKNIGKHNLKAWIS